MQLFFSYSYYFKNNRIQSSISARTATILIFTNFRSIFLLKVNNSGEPINRIPKSLNFATLMIIYYLFFFSLKELAQNTFNLIVSATVSPPDEPTFERTKVSNHQHD